MRFWATSLRSSQRVDGAQRRPSARPRSRPGSAAGLGGSPSVRRKNRSSSVAVCGASARIASAGLDERDRQRGGRLLGGLRSAARAGRARTPSMPRCARHDRGARVVVGRAQPPLAAGGALELVQRALEDDAAGAHDRDAVAELLDLGQQVAGEQDGRAARATAARRARACRACRPGRGRWRARRAAAASGRAAAPRRRRAAGACRASSRRRGGAGGRSARRRRAPRRSARAASPPSSAASSSRFLRPVRYG